MDPILANIQKGLDEISMIDAHTHVDASHITARGLHDVILYHMRISDLYGAGCPSGSRMPEFPSDKEVEERITEALPFLQHVENTSTTWGAKIILKDLYGWDKPITQDNWREIHEIIKKKSTEKSWAKEIMNRAGIARVATELWRGHNGLADDLLTYSIEWAFFTRAQWGQYDTALLELENAWNQDVPGEPLPVTADVTKLNFAKRIRTLEDVTQAIRHYCDKIPYDKISGIASHFSTDINYQIVTAGEMELALQNRASAGEKERDIYANYIFEEFLKEYSSKGHKAVLQFSVGAEPLPFETGSKLETRTVYQIASIINRYPNINFQIFLASDYQNQAFCTMARELPNLSLSGFWWHNFFPTIIRKIMGERLDMVATNKQIGFFSDAYCLEWAYAKAVIVKKQLAQVLCERVNQGQYTEKEALQIAERTLRDTPAALLNIRI